MNTSPDSEGNMNQFILIETISVLYMTDKNAIDFVINEPSIMVDFEGTHVKDASIRLTNDELRGYLFSFF